MVRNRQELLEQLEVQRRFVGASCGNYDAGFHQEAVRLAAAVYTIVHDASTRKMRSLLGQLDLKEAIVFAATNAPINEETLKVADKCTPLIEMERLYAPPQFVPLCTYQKNRGTYWGVRWLSFDEWWSKDIIFFERPSLTASRTI